MINDKKSIEAACSIPDWMLESDPEDANEILCDAGYELLDNGDFFVAVPSWARKAIETADYRVPSSKPKHLRAAIRCAWSIERKYDEQLQVTPDDGTTNRPAEYLAHKRDKAAKDREIRAKMKGR